MYVKETETELGIWSSLSFSFHDVLPRDFGHINPFSRSFFAFSTAFRRSTFRSFLSFAFCANSSLKSARFRSAILIKSSLNGHRFGTAILVFFRATFLDGLIPNDSNCLACFLDFLIKACFFFRTNFLVRKLAFLPPFVLLAEHRKAQIIYVNQSTT